MGTKSDSKVVIGPKIKAILIHQRAEAQSWHDSYVSQAKPLTVKLTTLNGLINEKLALVNEINEILGDA